MPLLPNVRVITVFMIVFSSSKICSVQARAYHILASLIAHSPKEEFARSIVDLQKGEHLPIALSKYSPPTHPLNLPNIFTDSSINNFALSLCFQTYQTPSPTRSAMSYEWISVFREQHLTKHSLSGKL
jgi:hypothetical protein